MSVAEHRTGSPPRRFDTVVARLLLLAGAPLLVVAVVGLFVYQGHVRPLVAAEALSGLRSTNASATALVDAWLDHQQSVIGYLTARPETVAWDTPRMLEHARRLADSFADVRAVVFADRDGTVVADSMGGGEGTVADREYFVTARGGHPAVQLVVRTRTSGNSSIIVARPVTDDAGGVSGVVFSVVEPARVARVLHSGTDGTDVVSFVVDGDGVIATGRDVGTEIAPDGLPHDAPDSPYENRDGVSVYGVSRRIEQAGWTVVSEIPAASVTTTFDSYNRVLAASLAASLAVAAAMAIVVALTIQAPVALLERLASRTEVRAPPRRSTPWTMTRAPVELRRVHERMLTMMDTIARRQRELARSNELLEAAQDIGHVGSWEYDVRSGLVTCSRELLRIGGAPGRDPVMHRSELLGLVHPEEREEVVTRFDRTLEADEPGFELEHRVRVTTTGEDRYVLHRVVHIRDESGRPVRSLGIVMDITERHGIEESLRLALEEKSVLLQEVHHRVRNNLAIVESILSLQRLQLSEDSHAHRALTDAQSRVTSMAVLHRYLYRSENLTEVHLAEYARTLLDSVEVSYGVPGIELHASLDDVVLDVSTAIPCGLVLNELVVNAYKHAFPHGSGRIHVRIEHDDGGAVEITVSDDGVGAPADTRIGEESGGLGSRLGRRLASQIGATLEYEVADGTRATLRFPAS